MTLNDLVSWLAGWLVNWLAPSVCVLMLPLRQSHSPIIHRFYPFFYKIEIHIYIYIFLFCLDDNDDSVVALVMRPPNKLWLGWFLHLILTRILLHFCPFAFAASRVFIVCIGICRVVDAPRRWRSDYLLEFVIYFSRKIKHTAKKMRQKWRIIKETWQLSERVCGECVREMPESFNWKILPEVVVTRTEWCGKLKNQMKLNETLKVFNSFKLEKEICGLLVCLWNCAGCLYVCCRPFGMLMTVVLFWFRWVYIFHSDTHRTITKQQHHALSDEIEVKNLG